MYTKLTTTNPNTQSKYTLQPTYSTALKESLTPTTQKPASWIRWIPESQILPIVEDRHFKPFFLLYFCYICERYI